MANLKEAITLYYEDENIDQIPHYEPVYVRAKNTDGHHKVIIPMHDEVARGTLRGILQQAEMSLETFMSLLD